MALKINLKVLSVLCAILLCCMVGPDVAVTAQGVQEAIGQAGIPIPAPGETRVPVPGGPGYVIASPFAMVPEFYFLEYGYLGSLFQHFSSGPGTYNIPIQVPHGATITKLVAYFYDAEISQNLTVTLNRDRFDDFVQEEMGQAFSFGTAGYINASDTSIDFATIDLSNYGYSVKVQFYDASAAIGFLGARIDFEYPTFLPDVVK